MGANFGDRVRGFVLPILVRSRRLKIDSRLFGSVAVPIARQSTQGALHRLRAPDLNFKNAQSRTSRRRVRQPASTTPKEPTRSPSREAEHPGLDCLRKAEAHWRGSCSGTHTAGYDGVRRVCPPVTQKKMPEHGPPPRPPPPHGSSSVRARASIGLCQGDRSACESLPAKGR